MARSTLNRACRTGNFPSGWQRANKSFTGFPDMAPRSNNTMLSIMYGYLRARGWWRVVYSCLDVTSPLAPRSPAIAATAINAAHIKVTCGAQGAWPRREGKHVAARDIIQERDKGLNRLRPDVLELQDQSPHRLRARPGESSVSAQHGASYMGVALGTAGARPRSAARHATFTEWDGGRGGGAHFIHEVLCAQTGVRGVREVVLPVPASSQPREAASPRRRAPAGAGRRGGTHGSHS